MPDEKKYLDTLFSLCSAIHERHDVGETLHLMLDQVTDLLHVDAVATLLSEPPDEKFQYIARRGFRTNEMDRLDSSRVADFLKRATLERPFVYIPDLREEKLSDHTELIHGEGFVSYYGVAYFSKEQILGGLEVFQRAPLRLDPEAIAFLKALSAEIVLGANNTRLYHQLEQSKLELALAYDASLQGWVRALDLRDRETAGHSLRVTELSLRLARAMGISDEQLVHVRLGALLHDIGKLGISDAILYKPGRLSEEELKMLKQHPTLGYHLLSPIPFLQPALDIVYCHHERWDGSGYPRGLRDEAIPLAARIFAVVDVWDALIADHPYRRGTPKEEAIAYIKELAGVKLDPQVVEAFLKVIHD